MEKTGRFDSVDALRAVAAFLVIWLHVSEVFSTVTTPARASTSLLYSLPERFDTGRIGVLIFFLVSGFVIPAGLRGETAPTARIFLIRRFFRLYPLYWISIPLSILTMWWPFDRSVESATLMVNLTMLQAVFCEPDISGLYWTLRVELYFYAICLGLFLLRCLDREITLVIAGVVIVPTLALIHLANGDRIGLSIWTQDAAFISIMFLGSLSRRYVDGRLSRAGQFVLAAIVLFYCAGFPCLLAYVYATRDTVHPDIVKILGSYALAVGVFAIALKLNLKSRLLSWLGKISYSLYLMHPIAFYTLYWLVARTGDAHWLRQLHISVYLFASFAATIALSAITYRFVEAPMMALAVKLTPRRQMVRGIA
ncbi:acyltransferase family protein [Rhizobium oryzicola]|uniref:Acyltransferase n=1 Tax=Rhizobium oryzicola TaxID=1232668 RepID=A0ABT8SPL9_9HYPH|nr:acyltransferase [Rhizobium oryzicola]MDO1580468.1 acyltransferase [Rhizobium oryzicola]